MTIAQMPSEVGQRIFDLLNDNSVALVTADGQILYGDQKRISVTPTVCVESGRTARSLQGVPQRTENSLRCYILVYYAKVESNQQTKLAAELCGEAIARYLDDNL